MKMKMMTTQASRIDNATDGAVESDTVDLMVLADLSDKFGDNNSLPLTRFRNVLSSPGMADMIIALHEAICVLHLGNNEKGAVTNDCKYNSLIGHWFVRDNDTKTSSGPK
eukprot:7366110-Ditylum_brightwellii.AAC.1